MESGERVGEMWLGREEWTEFYGRLARQLHDAVGRVQSGRVGTRWDPAAVRKELSAYDFREPKLLERVAEDVVGLLERGTVHAMHPGYFGMYDPSVTSAGVAAEMTAATFNPQLSVWTHAPAAVEMERCVVNEMAGMFGWKEGEATGHFTSGGAEANATSVLLGLTKVFPGFGDSGVYGLSGRPRMYVSAESHLAWLKISGQAGLGREAVCLVGTDGGGRMDMSELEAAIALDRKEGKAPFFVGATAGTTNAGMVDPLLAVCEVARREGMWFHVDAAWGGAVALDERVSSCLEGVLDADSLTVDPHKWFSVPRGAGMLLCRDEGLLEEAFRVSTDYMPSAMEGATDPYTHSMQWSRRFSGLAMFMSLATLGWGGYRDLVRVMRDKAEDLRGYLEADGWEVVNDSPMAVLCFEDAGGELDLGSVALKVASGGRSWISSTRFEGKTVLRACITSYFTQDEHLRDLVEGLSRARRELRGGLTRRGRRG